MLIEPTSLYLALTNPHAWPTWNRLIEPMFAVSDKFLPVGNEMMKALMRRVAMEQRRKRHNKERAITHE
jgi:hypothetical protein